MTVKQILEHLPYMCTSNDSLRLSNLNRWIYDNEKGFNNLVTIISVLANMNINMQKVPAYFVFSDSRFEQDRYFCLVFITSWHTTEYEKTAIFEKTVRKFLITYPMKFIQKNHF